MIWRGTRLVATLAAVALLAGVLSACGGSGSGPSSTSATAGGSEKSAGQGGEASPEKGHAGGGEGGPGGSNGGGQPAPVSPLHVSGGGSGQFRVEGDNSVQAFGEESDEGELEEAARVLHDFYVARAEEDWKTACASLSRGVIGQLEQLVSRAKSGYKGCPSALATLTPPLPPAVQRETTAVDAGSLRVEGDRGFLIYRGAERTVYAINMAREGGWKVGALVGIPLS